MPDVNANVVYRGIAARRVALPDRHRAALEGRPPARLLVRERGYGSVIGDVFGAAFPTWTLV